MSISSGSVWPAARAISARASAILKLAAAKTVSTLPVLAMVSAVFSFSSGSCLAACSNSAAAA
ncbi:MAG: hypothetical protein JWP92_860 [Caulobacter sp.]|nr:hypothetical protein [Caulobacter sp.]